MTADKASYYALGTNLSRRSNTKLRLKYRAQAKLYQVHKTCMPQAYSWWHSTSLSTKHLGVMTYSALEFFMSNVLTIQSHYASACLKPARGQRHSTSVTTCDYRYKHGGDKPVTGTRVRGQHCPTSEECGLLSASCSSPNLAEEYQEEAEEEKKKKEYILAIETCII